MLRTVILSPYIGGMFWVPVYFLSIFFLLEMWGRKVEDTEGREKEISVEEEVVLGFF